MPEDEAHCHESVTTENVSVENELPVIVIAARVEVVPTNIFPPVREVELSITKEFPIVKLAFWS